MINNKKENQLLNRNFVSAGGKTSNKISRMVNKEFYKKQK